MVQNASMLGKAWVELRPFKNGDATDLPAGSLVMMDYDNEDGLTGGKPNAYAAIAAGILVKGVEAGCQSNAAMAVEGPVACRFKGHASAKAGTYARPVPGQTYLTYSPSTTPFILLTDMTADTDVHTLDDGADAPQVLILPTLQSNPIHVYWATPEALDTDGFLNDQATSASAITTASTILDNPDVPRTVSVLPGGTTADVPAGDVTVNGTDIHGNTISDTVTFLANATEAKNTTKAFKTVTSVVFPIQDGAGATYDVGWTDNLGLPFCMKTSAVVRAALNGVLESTAATATAATTTEKSVVDLNSALNGTAVDVWIDRG